MVRLSLWEVSDYENMSYIKYNNETNERLLQSQREKMNGRDIVQQTNNSYIE